MLSETTQIRTLPHICMYVCVCACMYKGWATKPALAPRSLEIYCGFTPPHTISSINISDARTIEVVATFATLNTEYVWQHIFNKYKTFVQFSLVY
jgi:hypothetical protein